MEYLEKDPEIQKLIRRREQPTLEEIVKVLEKWDIKTVSTFWDTFDKILNLWKEHRSMF